MRSVEGGELELKPRRNCQPLALAGGNPHQGQRRFACLDLLLINVVIRTDADWILNVRIPDGVKPAVVGFNFW
jgi:hypothetical protein